MADEKHLREDRPSTLDLCATLNFTKNIKNNTRRIGNTVYHFGKKKIKLHLSLLNAN